MATNTPPPLPVDPPAASLWDAHAEGYEQVFERTTSLWGSDALVLGQLPAPSSSRFLDVACGPGSLAIAAARLGFAVTATDFSSAMVSRLTAKLESSSPSLKVSARVLDGQTLDGLTDESFEVVSSMFGIFMFPDREAAWRSAWRVLTPGGRLLASSWDANSANLRMIRYLVQNSKNKPDHVETSSSAMMSPAVNRTLHADSFRDELEEVGFGDVRVYSITHTMGFRSGAELVGGILDNAGFMSMVSHKQEASIKRCILEFTQLLMDGTDPFSDEAKEAAPVGELEAEQNRLWSQPIAFPVVGHLAVATKSV